MMTDPTDVDVWKVVEHVIEAMDESSMREELASHLFKYYKDPANCADLEKLLPEANKYVKDIHLLEATNETTI